MVLSEAQWRKRLTPEQFEVLRRKGTEQAFCGRFYDNKQEGVYACAGCDLPLFSSNAKFDSGTGWPSFLHPVAADNIKQRDDIGIGMVRVEVLCARCEGHLGHVFDDGPRKRAAVLPQLGCARVRPERSPRHAGRSSRRVAGRTHGGQALNSSQSSRWNDSRAGFRQLGYASSQRTDVLQAIGAAGTAEKVPPAAKSPPTETLATICSLTGSSAAGSTVFVSPDRSAIASIADARPQSSMTVGHRPGRQDAGAPQGRC